MLHKLNLDVPENKIFAFIGSNGAGKSTTMKLIMGLISPDSGMITVLGQDISKNKNVVLSQIGSLIDAPVFYPNLTAKEFLSIGCISKNLKLTEIDKSLNLVGLDVRSKKNIASYSLGMKQRLALAYALLGMPKLIILDEPTNGLDPQGMLDFRQLLERLRLQHGISIFISCHNLEEVEKIATDFAILDKGRIIYQSSMNLWLAQVNGTFCIEVSDATSAVKLLGINGYSAKNDDSCICVENTDLSERARIHKLLISNGIDVYRSYDKKTKLEDWYINQLEVKCYA